VGNKTNVSPFESLAQSATTGEYRFLARVILAREMSLQDVASLCGRKKETILASFSIYGKTSISASTIAKVLGLNQMFLRAAQADDGSSLSAGDLKQLHSDAITAIQSSGLLPGVSDHLATDADAVLRKNPSVRRIALRKFVGAWIPLLGRVLHLQFRGKRFHRVFMRCC